MIQWFILSTRCGQGPVKSLSKGCSVILEISESERRWFDSNLSAILSHWGRKKKTLSRRQSCPTGTWRPLQVRCCDSPRLIYASSMLEDRRMGFKRHNRHWPHAPTSLTSGWTLSNPSTRGSRSPADLRLSFSVQLFGRTCLSLSQTITNSRHPQKVVHVLIHCVSSGLIFNCARHCPHGFHWYCSNWSVSERFQETCASPNVTGALSVCVSDAETKWALVLSTDPTPKLWWIIHTSR